MRDKFHERKAIAIVDGKVNETEVVRIVTDEVAGKRDRHET